MMNLENNPQYKFANEFGANATIETSTGCTLVSGGFMPPKPKNKQEERDWLEFEEYERKRKEYYDYLEANNLNGGL